ncbi:sodium:calcium antiporter [Thalassoglobus sp.]|uniref:sodium:calcium antiporter n=1 Tax=Thalassoglobus sp. TaxID=2795869 RepID=UPI003AA87C14
MSTEISPESTPQENSDNEPSQTGLLVSIVIFIAFAAFWWLSSTTEATWATLGFLMFEVAVISIVIWQACDPFADAAQWVGQKLQIPGSVRGATLDAIASSMPELFSGIFFVVLAIQAVSGGGDAKAIEAAGAEGYGSTIATCAGSAVYNMILIPAFCALVIAYTRKERPTIDVEDEVISRDGVWFVACEMLLILFLFQNTMYWWMGIIFLIAYAIYIYQLYHDALVFRRKMAAIKSYLTETSADVEIGEVIDALHAQGLNVSRTLTMQAQDEIRLHISREELEEEETPDEAGAFFGYLSIPLNNLSTPLILLTATIVSAVACYFLVEVTIETAKELAVPAFFVAVILAAAASSVPDTFLAIAAARRGDDSGAVSNAFGSNIFDICVCLSIPLLVNSYLTGWQPVTLLQDGKPIAGLVGLRILLVALTVATLAIMWHNRQLTFKKAIVLCGLYAIFIAYAVLGSLGILF